LHEPTDRRRLDHVLRGLDRTIDLRDRSDEAADIDRLADEVAGRYLLRRAAPTARQQRAAEEMRSALALVRELRAQLDAAPAAAPAALRLD
jgi:replicative DNA helicase